MSAQPVPNIDKCHTCNKLIPRGAVSLCSRCVLSEDNRYEVVRSFVKQNPGSSIPEVATATGVRVGEVSRFCSAGRLQRVD